MKTHFSLPVDQDWVYFKPEVGSILKFLGSDYDIEKQRTHFAFEIIGLPAPERQTNIKFVYE